MPRRDGSGPDGQGAKTGRGLGNCTDTEKKSTTPNVVKPGGWTKVKGRNRRRNRSGDQDGT